MAQGSITKWLAGGIILAILLFVLLSFHFVFGGGSPRAVIPKSSLTLRLTFVSVSDVVERWNNETDLWTKASDKLFVNLVNEMERRGLISRGSSG